MTDFWLAMALGAARMDNLPVAGGRLAGGHELGDQFELVVVAGVGRLDLGHADPATGDHAHAGVVAVMGYLDPVFQGDVEDGLLALEFAELAVNGDLRHRGFPRVSYPD